MTLKHGNIVATELSRAQLWALVSFVTTFSSHLLYNLLKDPKADWILLDILISEPKTAFFLASSNRFSSNILPFLTINMQIKSLKYGMQPEKLFN